MKSYLSLIPIYAKVHKRQNRLTLLCIIFAVFLVTAIFSMADMGVRMEKAKLLDKHGNLSFEDILNNTMAQMLFITAAILFVLILIAGILMISNSMNTNVAQRTQFFGMMRCIGMSKKQIIRFVRLEALSWCKTAVPVGVVLGIIITWALCMFLRFIVGEEFSGLPPFGLSLVGVSSGILVGFISVLVAAKSPANRAAKVSPISAVSGNSENTKIITHAANTRFSTIETALGFNHAVSSKKNFVLMISSFALSIMLFLSFSVLIDFVDHLMPQYTNTPDINISSSDSSNSIDSMLVNEINTMKGVKHAYGRSNSFNVPVNWNKNARLPDAVDLISFDDFDLNSLKKDNMLRKGSDISKVQGDSNSVLAICGKDVSLDIGDAVTAGNENLKIAGILKYDPFSSDGDTKGKITIITSKETFTRLTGEDGYSLIMVQTKKDATDMDVGKISSILDKNCTFQDVRDKRTTNTYIAFQICIYGFLSIIALVTILNIMNSISMSVSARIKQYGAMRAVGMGVNQITKMITAEAITYALVGGVIGCIFGLSANYMMFNTLIANHYKFATWGVPIIPIMVVLIFVIAATIMAVYAPSRRIRNLVITETINEL